MKATESETEVARVLRELMESETALAERVGKVGRGIREPALVVGIRHAERSRCVTRSTSERFPIGCVMKLLTGALVLQAVAKGQLSLESRIAELLGGAAADHESLNGITIRHLLEHTHGLDCADTAAVPFRDDGFIDAAALCRFVTAHPPLAAPGLLYSYGNHGAQLLAAALERATRTPFSTLLSRELLEPLDLESNFAEIELPKALHPAVGGQLMLSASSILRFLRHAIARIDAATTPLPGWNSVERGIHLGWKRYESGWFGHNSIATDAPSMVRIHPERGIAVVIATTGYSPPAAALEIFGDFMPSVAASETPTPASASETNPAPELLCGTYSNASSDLHITRTEKGIGLQAMRPSVGESAQPFHQASLRRAANNLYFVMPPSHAHFPFLQFIRPTPRGFEYLWNGERLWRYRSP